MKSLFLFCLFVVASPKPIFGETAPITSAISTSKAETGAPKIQVVTNTGGRFVVELSLNTTSGSPWIREIDLGNARREFTTSTNTGGYSLFLYAPTNRFTGASQVEINLTVLNATTTSSPMIRWAGERPLFGECVVSNMTTGQALPCRPTEASLVSVSGVCLLPVNQRRFRLNPMNFFGPQDRGDFAVQFHGVLPSILEPGKYVEFETAPLVLTIEEPKPGTNAPPITPKR